MSSSNRRVVHVTAERQPVAKVGGLGEATAGLGDALGRLGWSIETVMPDYGDIALADEVSETLDVPSWAGRCWSRSGRLAGVGRVTLIGSRRIRRSHPYVDPETGESWPDNDARFFAFSAGVAALLGKNPPDLVHLHDWHAAAVASFAHDELPELPIVLTIHNLAHQGVAPERWLTTFGRAGEPMRLPGVCDPLVGAIRTADAIVAVSPTYRREIIGPRGEGIAEILRSRAGDVFGIVNGIDTSVWNPATDPRIPYAFDRRNMSGKAACRQKLLASIDRNPRRGPVVAIVARMAEQKGIDLALRTAETIAAHDGVLMVHGAGQHDVCDLTHRAELADHDHVVVIDDYHETTAHRLLAGADMLLMPSRFEPCGLTQMQAMTYGTIPIVTDVGGLHDTVIDTDRDRLGGTGFIARHANVTDIVDAVARAISRWTDATGWSALQRRAMAHDWSWREPALEYDALYRRLLDLETTRAIVDLTDAAAKLTTSVSDYRVAALS